MKGLRIRYWVQDTHETGHYELTAMVKEKDAPKHLELYKGQSGEIVDNDEEY